MANDNAPLLPRYPVGSSIASTVASLVGLGTTAGLTYTNQDKIRQSNGLLALTTLMFLGSGVAVTTSIGHLTNIYGTNGRNQANLSDRG